VLPDDREKLAALHKEFERWGRYKVVVQPGQAELVVAIRTGRQAMVGGGAPVTGPPLRTPEESLRIETATADDALLVYASSSLNTPLWRGQLARGLRGSPPPLFERFRSDVEQAAKKP